jgi:hypothetical protein
VASSEQLRVNCEQVLDKDRLRKKRFGLSSTALNSCMREVALHKLLVHPNVVSLRKVLEM